MPEHEIPATNRVIIIDDDHLVRDFAVQTIEYSVNRKVTAFDSGFSAWQFVRNQPDDVDVVIADVNIPEMDGFELLTQFKRKHPKKAFIITTSNPRHEQTACRLGADAFMLKPFDINELFILVKQFIMRLGNKTSENMTLIPINNGQDQPTVQ